MYHMSNSSRDRGHKPVKAGVIPNRKQEPAPPSGVAADAKRRVATMAVDPNPRKVKGNVHDKEKDHEGSRECERMVRWKRVRRPVWRQSQVIMETSLEMALGLPFASRRGAMQVMENR